VRAAALVVCLPVRWPISLIEHMARRQRSSASDTRQRNELYASRTNYILSIPMLL
jgi:hypothetical protein